MSRTARRSLYASWLALAACAPEAQIDQSIAATTQKLSAATITSGLNSAYCLTARGGGQSDGTPVDVAPCNGSASQQWVQSGAQLMNGSKCLDDPGGNTANGTPLNLWSCWGGSNQQWNTANAQIQLANTGKCVDIPGGNVANAQLQLYDCWGGQNQKWTLNTPQANTTIPDKQLGAVPALGWNSWNAFGCNVNEQLIRATADAMGSSGLKAAGYKYLVLDDCWAAGRDGNGQLVSDRATFPSGIAALAAYVHNQGLKFGLYTSAGQETCAHRPGSHGHEAQDMATFAQWGVDYVKIDWCSADGMTPRVQYPLFSRGIAAAGRKMLVSISDFGRDDVWTWGATVGNSWRTTDDVTDTWTAIIGNMFSNARFPDYAGPGGYNDLDMLELGNGGMSATEDTTHFNIWAIEASPLMAGTDLRNISAAAKATLTNAEVLAVNQDARGLQGKFIYNDNNNVAVISKPLTSGGVALLLLNMTTQPASITANFSNAGLSGSTSYRVRDLWSHSDVGRFTGSFTATAIPAHGSRFITVNP